MAGIDAFLHCRTMTPGSETGGSQADPNFGKLWLKIFYVHLLPHSRGII